MGIRWLAVLGCVSLCFALAHAAALPTTETLVVTKADEQATSSPIDTDAGSTAKVDTTVVTTEEPSPPVKVMEMDVRSEVTMRYAHTAVVTRVKNPAKRAQEAFFRVLLPETAFVSGFTMILDGKAYKAYVKKKEEAKQIYNDAVSQGLGAAHIATKARDSNHFTVSVNVEPNTTAVFNLTYEELLVRRNNVYNHAINLHPGTLVPKLTVTVHIKESQKITTLRVPEVRTGNEIDATEEDPQNSKAVIERGKNENEATITFTPDLEEQKRLVDIYLAKTKESQSHQNHAWYPHREEEESTPEGVLGQFVVQYDVDRSDKGEVLVNDGYFVHFFAPTSLPPLDKHVVFVLDTSGSMAERKIEQLRQAMQTILTELNPGDYFSIVSFATSVKVHDLTEADKEPPKATYYYFDSEAPPAVLVPPYPATPDNVVKAKVIVQRLNANGGTNIGKALDTAVELIQKGVDWKPEGNKTKPAGEPLPSPVSVEADKKTEKLTAEKQEEKTEISNDAATTPAPAQDKAKETESKKTDKQLEPIIIFLTDGDPTVGEVNPKRIISRLSEKNYGDKKASIFSLAFGEDADRKFLRKLSLRNDGFMRHIYEAADAALQLRDFYRQVASPLLAHVKFNYPKEQIKEGSLTKHEFRTVYAGSEAVVAGRYSDEASFEPMVYGVCGVKDHGEIRRKFETTPPIVRNAGQYLPLERLWAYLTIKQLLDEKDASEDLDSETASDKEKGAENKALDIALKYEFVTPLTSLVVVKPNATKAVDAESVDKEDKPGPVPYGVALSGMAGPPGQFAPASALYFSRPANTALSHQYSIIRQSPSASMYRSSLVHHSRPMSSFGSPYNSYLRGPSQFALYAPKSAFSSAIGAGQPVQDFVLESNVQEDPVDDYGDRVYGGGFISSLKHKIAPAASLLPAAQYPTTTRPLNILETYHLAGYDWLISLKQADSDSIVVPGNQTKLELSTADSAPKEASGDLECARATDGAAGVCVYLTRCGAARSITPDEYSQTFCSISNKYAGVCCPKAEVDKTN